MRCDARLVSDIGEDVEASSLTELRRRIIMRKAEAILKIDFFGFGAI